MNRKVFVPCALLVFVFLYPLMYPVHAQSVGFEKLWGASLGGDSAMDVAIASDGSIYVVGTTHYIINPRVSGADVFILKYDSSGNLLWQRAWGGLNPDYGLGVAMAPDGNIYVVGETCSFDGLDAFILKFDPDGNLLWQRLWGARLGAADANGLAVAPDGNIYVSGGYVDGMKFILKFDSAGNLIWQKTFRSIKDGIFDNIYNFAGGVAVASDGSLYLSGAALEHEGGEWPSTLDILVIKLDSAGNLIWNRIWETKMEGEDEPLGVILAPDNGIYVLGWTYFYNARDSDAFLLRLDSAGNLLWLRIWGGPLDDVANGGVLAPDGGVYLVGYTYSFGAGGRDAFILKFDAMGNLAWQKTFGGSGRDEAFGVASGSAYVVGYTDSPTRTLSDVAGTVTTPIAWELPITGEMKSLSGTVTSPNGMVVTPSGEPPKGGGDAFLISLEELLPPTIETCDETGVEKNLFNIDDTIYVYGIGYTSTTYDIYIVEDTTWTDGMPFPSRVPGTATSITSDPSGNIPTTAVWSPPLRFGKYDMAVDINGNGVYDEGIDALDDNDIEISAGFFVIPESPLGTLTALAAMIISLALFPRRSFRKLLSHKGAM